MDFLLVPAHGNLGLVSGVDVPSIAPLADPVSIFDDPDLCILTFGITNHRVNAASSEASQSCSLGSLPAENQV